jgi:hypothetical protein
MNRTSIALVLGLAAVACQSDRSARFDRRAPPTSAPSGLEEVTILARGME